MTGNNVFKEFTEVMYSDTCGVKIFYSLLNKSMPIGP